MRAESREQIKLLETDIGKSVDLCHEKIEDLTKTIKKQNENLKALEEKYSKSLEENKNLQKRVSELEIRLDDLDQYSRSNTLEINGIPETANENVLEIVKTMGRSLDYQITDDMVDACHRLGQKLQDRPRGIIVKFTRRTVKEQLLEKRRIKRNFNTKDIGFTDKPADVIYISESLTLRRRKLFNAARALKKEKGFQFLWVRNGKILLRTQEGAKVILVTSMEQIATLQETRTIEPATTATD